MFEQSELLRNAVGNVLIHLELVEEMGGGRMGDEIEFEGAGIESVVGRLLEWAVDEQDERIAWEVLRPCQVLMEIAESFVVGRRL